MGDNLATSSDRWSIPGHMVLRGPGKATLPLSRELVQYQSGCSHDSAYERKLTVSFDLATRTFNDFAKLRPFGEVFQVEADIIRFRQVVEVTRVDLQKIHWRHRPYRCHWSGYTSDFRGPHRRLGRIEIFSTSTFRGVMIAISLRFFDVKGCLFASF